MMGRFLGLLLLAVVLIPGAGATEPACVETYSEGGVDVNLDSCYKLVADVQIPARVGGAAS